MHDKAMAELRRKIDSHDASHHEIERYLALTRRSGRHSFEFEYLSCEFSSPAFRFYSKPIRGRSDLDKLEYDFCKNSENIVESTLAAIHHSLVDRYFIGEKNAIRVEEYFEGRWARKDRYFSLSISEMIYFSISVDAGNGTLFDLLLLWSELRSFCPYIYFSEGVELFSVQAFYEEFCLPAILMAKLSEDHYDQVSAPIWEKNFENLISQIPIPQEPFFSEDEDDSEWT